MIASITVSQAQIDAELAKYDITPVGRNTSTGLHKLYQDEAGNPLTMPNSIDGYSYFTFQQIMGIVLRQRPGIVVKGRSYVAETKAGLRLVDGEEE